ncbi:HIT domain-containing protein [Streptomyces sp. NPDC001381]|uniref:HIT domain-containing protein n=1 Tax=Streptomyces sp. NPDC001381 TaxID=3364567 RepID=UPI0036913D78
MTGRAVRTRVLPRQRPRRGTARPGRRHCVFCRLIREDSAQWTARESEVCAFTPLNPLAPGHTLVIPTRHYTDVFSAPPDVLNASLALVRRVATAMRTVLGATGVNILRASGPGSEQSVPHLHFHVVPRRVDDGISTWPTSRSRHHLTGDAGARLAHALNRGQEPALEAEPDGPRPPFQPRA